MNESTKVAAVAPQKVAKKAVSRNKLRRQMYEAISPVLADVSEGFYAIVFAKATAIAAKFADLKADMRSIFVKASLLR